MRKVSIVMPMLNSIKFLRECMDSVVNQTLHDIEIIVVDAGSDDGTVETLNEYAKKDSRVKIIHSDKRSMGAQYNLGISMATGEYIGFVESDDYIVPEMYEVLYTKAKEISADWLKSNYYFFMDYPGIGRGLMPVHEKKYMGYGKCFSPADFPEQLILENYMWNGIYRTEMVKGCGVKLNETPGASFQDTGFVMQSYMQSSRCMFLDNCLYCYRRDNPGSSAHMLNSIIFERQEVDFLSRWFDGHAREAEIYYGSWYIRSTNLFYTFVDKLSEAQELSEEIIENTASFADFLTKNAPRNSFKTDYFSSDRYLRMNKEYCKSGVLNLISTRSKMARWRDQKTQKALEELLNHNKVIIFGCGDNGLGLLSYLVRKQCMKEILLCDNADKYWGKIILGTLVISPKELENHKDYYISIANAEYFDDILFQCLAIGFDENMVQKAPDIMRVRGTNLMKESEELPIL